METAFVKSSQVYHLLTMNDHNWMADYKDTLLLGTLLKKRS